MDMNRPVQALLPYCVLLHILTYRLAFTFYRIPLTYLPVVSGSGLGIRLLNNVFSRALLLLLPPLYPEQLFPVVGNCLTLPNDYVIPKFLLSSLYYFYVSTRLTPRYPLLPAILGPSLPFVLLLP